ncbi:MAG: hypothetical protein SGARI_003066 [Bacillariaceae sp.]
MQGNEELYGECRAKLSELKLFLADQWSDDSINADMELGNQMYDILPQLVGNSGLDSVSPEMMIQAAAISEATTERGAPGYGPPTYPQIPGQEFFGQLLLRNSEYELAMEAFETSLSFNPNRLPSLLGAVDASIGMKDAKQAKSYWSLVQSQMADADDEAIVATNLISLITEVNLLAGDEEKEAESNDDQNDDSAGSTNGSSKSSIS